MSFRDTAIKLVFPSEARNPHRSLLQQKRLLKAVENRICVQERKKVSKKIPQILLKTRKHHLHDLLSHFILKTCLITNAV